MRLQLPCEDSRGSKPIRSPSISDKLEVQEIEARPESPKKSKSTGDLPDQNRETTVCSTTSQQIRHALSCCPYCCRSNKELPWAFRDVNDLPKADCHGSFPLLSQTQANLTKFEIELLIGIVSEQTWDSCSKSPCLTIPCATYVF